MLNLRYENTNCVIEARMLQRGIYEVSETILNETEITLRTIHRDAAVQHFLACVGIDASVGETWYRS